MARPSRQQLNAATGAASSARTTQSPGVAVQAPITAPVGPNPLGALADALGVGADIALGKAGREAAKRRAEQDEIERLEMTARAENDVRNNMEDPELIRKNATYAKRLRTYRGNRVGAELKQEFLADAEQYRKDNPTVDEVTMRSWIAEWRQTRVYDEDGEPLFDLDDPIQSALVNSQLDEAGYAFLTKDRQVLSENLKAASGDEIEATIFATVREAGEITSEDYQDVFTGYLQAGFTEDEANARVVALARSVAEELDDDVALAAIPRKWEGGQASPWDDPETNETLDSLSEVYQAEKEARRLKALEPARLAWRLQMEANAAKGIPPTREEMVQGLSIGMSDSAIAAFSGKAASERERRRREAAREAREAARHQELMQGMLGSPYSVDRSKAEDAYSREYMNAGSPDAQSQVIVDAVKNRGVLPGVVRNRLNRVPINADDMGDWVAGIQQVRNLDPQVYASLDQGARNAFEAWNGLRASADFNPVRAFERIQAQDPEAGASFLKSEQGRELVEDLIGDDATSYARRKAEQIVRSFGSFSDMPPSEIEKLSRESFQSSYFTSGGTAYNRAYARDEDFVEWTKEYFAEQLNKKGTRVEADDLILAPLGDGSQFMIRERNGPEHFTSPFSYDLLQRSYMAETMKDIRVKHGDEAFGAASQGLDPYRHIPGEVNRAQRISRELSAAKDIEKRSLED